MADLLHERQLSVGFRVQSDYRTEAATGIPADWSWITSTPPEIAPAREVEDLGLVAPQPMAEIAPAVGSQYGGTFKITFPLTSQEAGYDPSAGDPVLTPELALIADCWGSSSIDSWLASVLSGAQTANVLTTGVGDEMTEGAAMAFGSTTVAKAIGWIKSVVATTTTLFEDLRAAVVATDNGIPMITIYPTTTTPTARTFRVVGADGHDLRYVGCVPVKLEMSLESGKVIFATVTFSFAKTVFSPTGGGPGLQIPTAYSRIPALLGDFGARLWIDGANLQDGTPEPLGSCDVVNVSLTIDLVHRETKCHGATQGVADVEVVDRKLSLTATVPYSDEHSDAGGIPDVENALANGTGFSLSVESGDTPGALFAMLIPNLQIKDQYSFGSENGVYALGFTGNAGPYSGDEVGAAAPANTVARLAVG